MFCSVQAVFAETASHVADCLLVCHLTLTTISCISLAETKTWQASMADMSAQKRQAVGESHSTKTALPRQGSTLWRRVASAHLLEAAMQVRKLLLERGRPERIKRE